MQKIVFVYRKNNDDFIDGIFDFFHKLMMPDTYTCDSCEVTHNYSGMRSAWKSYIEWLPFPSDFFDEYQFLTAFPNIGKVSFPSVFILNLDGNLKQIISSEELKDAGLAKLITLINNQIVSCRVK
jgi:hypothetical protein